MDSSSNLLARSYVRQTSVQVRNAFLDAGLLVCVYLVATFTTRSYFMGDTVDYADSIAAAFQGRNYYFWEFGHVLWRPLGYVVLRVLQPLTAHFVGSDVRLQAVLVLIVLSWLSGLLSVLSLHQILIRYCSKRWVVLITSITFVFGLSFLNYFHSGAPYIPGLSLIVLALYCITAASPERAISLKRSMLSGCILAGAVCFWLPYVVVTPAVAVSACCLQGFDRLRIRSAVLVLMSAGILTIVVYMAVAAHIGVRSPDQFTAWMKMTSGAAATTPNKGVTKALFGFVRAFVSMGNDGKLFKRYLLRDSFNPVSLFDLAIRSLWKIAAFYLFLLAIVLCLVTSANGRRVFGLLVIAAVPTLAFAVYWQGGDPERYLALMPFIMLAAAASLESPARALFRYAVAIFLCGAAVFNIAALATPRLNAQQQVSAARVNALLPNLNSRSFVVTANWQDDLVNFNRTFPFNPVNQDENLHIGSVIVPGNAEVGQWRQVFQKSAELTWENGGQFWVSRRLLATRPQPDWNWVEGDDPRVSWSDLHRFFSQLQWEQEVGGEDGFLLLSPSSQNREILRRLVQHK